MIMMIEILKLDLIFIGEDFLVKRLKFL